MVRTAATIAMTMTVWAASSVAGEPSTPSGHHRDWPMFRGNPQQTGTAPGELPARLRILWRFESPEPFTSTAAIAGGTVYLGDDGGTLFAISLSDGKARWKYETGEPIRSSPTVSDGVVFFGDSAGVFHAVDAKTGAVRWTYETQGEIVASANVAGDRVLVGSYDGQLYCLERNKGELLWQYTTEGRIHGSSAIVGDLVLVAGCDENFHVVRLASGETARQVRLGSVSGSSVAVQGDMGYVGTYGHSVIGLDWKKGDVRWVFKDPDRQFPFMASAAVRDRFVVIAGRDRRVRALDAESGRVLWTFSTQGRNDASAVIVGDRVYQPSSDGNLYVLSLESGTEVGRFEAGSPMSASPAVSDGRLVIGTEDGIVYCLGAGME